MERTKLIYARAKKHWTQDQAAGFVSVDVGTYRKWEKGTASPRASNIHCLCEAFDTTASELGLDDNDCPRPSLHPDLSLMIGTDFTMRLFTIIFGPYQQRQTIQNEMTRVIKEDTMTDTLTRRDALRRVAALPLLTLGLGAATPTTVQRPPEEVLKQCAAGITACWELSKGDDESDLTLAFKGASAYLPTLKAIVDESAKYRKEAANLAGQCALLKCLLAWHLYGLKEAIEYGEEAVTYAKEAGDIPMLLSTLDYLAWAHYYNKHAKTALKVISYAVPYIKQSKGAPLSPHLLGGVYSTIALMSARNQQPGTPSLRQAAEHFFAAPETDDRMVYMDYTQADLVLNDGMVHYHQGSYETAMDSLSQLIDPETLTAKMPIPERSRVEGLNFMTLASLKTKRKDMEWSLRTWKTAITEATKLKSEQRFSEASLAYDIMEGIWSDEKHVTELRELVTHW